MFGLFSKKPLIITSPVNGTVVELQATNDEVFANNLAGDGVAIIPSDGDFVSPIDGIISKIFDTNHAFIIKSKQGIEVTVHIGIDTVYLDSKAFERIAKEGDSVKAGDLIIRADLEYIHDNAKEIITPIIIADEKSYKSIEKSFGKVTKDMTIMEVK